MIYVAYTYGLAEDWRDHVDPPAQGVMKDETYQAKLPELWAKKELSVAGELNLTASVLTGFAFETGTTRVVAGPDLSLAAVLHSLAGLVRSLQQPVFGIGVHRAIKKAAWEVVRSGGSVDPVLWMDESGGKAVLTTLDPYMASGARSHGVSLEAWLAYFGVRGEFNTVDNQLTMLRDIAYKMGFEL